MVKLIRLTTENDNNFNVDMDSDLKLKANASVALQNLTFESKFTTLAVGGQDRTVFHNFNVTEYPGVNYSEQLEIKDYTSANYLEFFDDLEGALNDTCSLGSVGGQPGDTDPMNNYMQFNVTEDEDKKAIQFRVTPMIHPLLKTRAFDYQYYAQQPQSGYERTNVMFTSYPAGYTDISPTDPTTPGVWLRAVGAAGSGVGVPEAIEFGIVSREDGTNSVNRDRYIHPAPGVEWSKGNAVWWCRVHELTGNAGNKQEHGFAIGLSKSQIPGQATLASTHRDYEIRVYDGNHNIEFIDPVIANTPQNGGIAPHEFTAGNHENHDIMMLRKDRNVIKGIYFTVAGGGTETELFSYTIPASERNKPLYPYAYWCGAFEQAKMGQPSMTIDPFAIKNIDGGGAYEALLTPQIGDLYGILGALPGEGGAGWESGYDRCGASLQALLPVLNQNIYENVPLPGQITTVTIAKQVLRWMGFDGPNYEGSGNHIFFPRFNADEFGGTYGYEIIPENVFQLINSDNYVVVLDSNPLMSFNASESRGLLLNDPKASKIGTRLNILATIPVNNNSGIVEFDSNELVYIDMDNEYPQTISNLRLRVLDKDLKPVITKGDSVMTLLFKD